jgi:glycosyltransferase involved in cell wall biosynthesis
MKIAMVGLRSPWGTEGGVEQSVAELAPRLARRGWDVTVYCRDRYNPHGNCVRDGVRLVDVPTVYSRSLEALVHSAVCAPRAALRHDLVHIHACGPGLFAPLPRLLGRSTVVTIHGKDWEREKWGPAARTLLRAGSDVAMNAADRLIVVSRALEEWYAGRARAPVRRVPNGVAPHDGVAWDPSIFPMLRPGRYLLFIGRLVPEKGIDTLVAAARRAALAMPVVIVGGSSYTPGYVARLRREASEGVVFTGPRFGLEKRMLLSHARAFVFPSRMEGLPIALLEAMAAGLPVAVSDIPPNAEAVGETGAWKVPVDEVGAWAGALSRLESSDGQILRAMGSRLRERATKHFSWDAVADRTAAIYGELVGDEPASARARA